MDYTGIVQLIIATIFYSTLVAPNIKKMSELRSDISDMRFPLKSDPGYAKQSDILGTAINKKMKQYSALYAETTKFLIFLYIAMSVAIVLQASPIIYNLANSIEIEIDKVIAVIVTAIVFVLLVIAMKIFILKPEKIRTFDWLSSVGISLTYTHDIFKSSLEINQVSPNLKESNNHVNLFLASNIILYGYSLILTIENVSGDKIYHLVAGRIQKNKYLKLQNTYYHDGQTRAALNLVHSLRLKPGEYKARLLVFETVFPGNRNPSEVLGGFTVEESDGTGSIVDLDLNTTTTNYRFKSEKDKPTGLEFKDDFDDGEGIRILLSSAKFSKKFERAKKLYCFGEINGMLTRDLIEKVFSPSYVLRKRIIARIFRKPSKEKKDPQIDLR